MQVTSAVRTAVPRLPVRTPRLDLSARPFLVLLELTRACELACAHCRAEAAPARHTDELTTAEIIAVLDDLADLGPPRPVVVLTGGDAFIREDLADLVRHGARRGLAMAVSPSGTSRATRGRLAEVRAAGAGAVSFSLDGATAERHDAFRGVPGSYDWTVAGCRAARDVGLRLQVNTTVTEGTVTDLPRIAGLVRELDASLWSVFFLVATGRGRALAPLSADDTEDVLHFLCDASRIVPLKTTEAPHYRRIVAERSAGARASVSPRGERYRALVAELDRFADSSETRPDAPPRQAPRFRPPLAVGDGRGVVFVSHTGEVSPSGFLPIVVGNVRSDRLTRIYQSAPLLRALRDPQRLTGRCGRCEHRTICGGSRARAYASAGDPLAEDPACSFVP